MPPTDYEDYRRRLGAGIKRLRSDLPDTLAGFERLRTGALAAGAIDAKGKELIATGIAIASGCKGCVAFHVHDALRAGARREEIEEVIGIAVLMAGGPGLMYGAEALEALDQFEAQARE